MANHDKNMVLRHAREKRYRQSHKGRKKRNIAQNKRRSLNPQKRRDWRLSKYGVSEQDYQDMVRQQGGMCAICFRTEKQNQFKKLRIDHDHNTGKIRGLLCHHCNVSLGHMGDCIPLLKNAIDYLRAHGGNETGWPTE